MDNLKRQEEAMKTERQSLSSFEQVSWFILCASRDMGPRLNTHSKGQLVVHWCSVRYQSDSKHDHNHVAL